MSKLAELQKQIDVLKAQLSDHIDNNCTAALCPSGGGTKDWPQEEWKDIEGYEGAYEVSSLGYVKNVRERKSRPGRIYPPQEKLMTTSVTNGYRRVMLSKDGEKTNFKVSRLVAKAFIDNPEGKATVNHMDCDKLNDNVSNLEWMTNQENCLHARDNGLFNPPKGERNGNAKLNEEQVKIIRGMLYEDDMTQREIAKVFSVNESTITKIKKNLRWKTEEFPTDGDEYWYLADTCEVREARLMYGPSKEWGEARADLGNCFRTCEEAEMYALRIESLSKGFIPKEGEGFWAWDFNVDGAKRGGTVKVYVMDVKFRTKEECQTWYDEFGESWNFPYKT